jgi:hypothetical protein
MRYRHDMATLLHERTSLAGSLSEFSISLTDHSTGQKHQRYSSDGEFASEM